MNPAHMGDPRREWLAHVAVPGSLFSYEVGERAEDRGCCVTTHHGVPAVQEMKEGPSEPLYRQRLQTTLSCCSQKLWW